jgi:hemerythrin-like domain-containing protein
MMRLAHEAVRLDLDEIEELFKEKNFAKLRVVWAKLDRFVQLHMRHEEELFFPILDKEFDDAVADAKLRDEHTSDIAEREKIRDLIQAAADDKDEEDDDVSKLEKKLKTFVEHHRFHLEHEEEVMMPKTMKLGSLPERCAIVNSLIALDRDEFRNFMFPHVVEKLAAGRPPPMLANYLKGVRAASFYPEWVDMALIAWDVLPEKIKKNPEHPAMGVLLPVIPEEERGEAAAPAKEAKAEKKEPEVASKPAAASNELDLGALQGALKALGLDLDALRKVKETESEDKTSALRKVKETESEDKTSSKAKPSKKDSKLDRKDSKRSKRSKKSKK